MSENPDFYCRWIFGCMTDQFIETVFHHDFLMNRTGQFGFSKFGKCTGKSRFRRKRPVRYMSGGRTNADRKLKNYFEAGFQNGGRRESPARRHGIHDKWTCIFHQIRTLRFDEKRCFWIQNCSNLGSEQTIYARAFIGESEPKKGCFFVSCFSPLGYEFWNRCVLDTRQTENLAVNRRFWCRGMWKQRILRFSGIS